MDRRLFLGVGAAASAASLAAATAPTPPAPVAPRPLVRPRALKPGDRVGVVDLSTPLYDPIIADRIRSLFAALDLVPVMAPHLLGRSREIGASRVERVSDLHDMFADPTIRGVFCARGGYGVSEVVANLDYEVIRAHPKVFLGFSDITLLHLAIRRRAGLVTFHGHMPGQSAFGPFTLEAVRRAVFSPAPLGVLPMPEETHPLRPQYPLRTLHPGVATGPLVGGNLSLVIAAMGTPWELDTTGAILFLEDVDENAYAIGRMLWQLRHAGKLSAAAGIVIGACVDCEKITDSSPYSLNEHLDMVLKDLGVPVLSGLVLGHTEDQLTVPLGVTATLDATRQTLSVLEPGVVA